MDRGGYDSTALSPGGSPWGENRRAGRGTGSLGCREASQGASGLPSVKRDTGTTGHILSLGRRAVCARMLQVSLPWSPSSWKSRDSRGWSIQAHLSGPSQGRPCCCWQGYLPTPHRMVPSLLGTTGPHPCPQQANAQSLLTFTQPLLPRHPAQAPRPCCKACLLPSTGAAPGGARSRRPGWPYHGLLPPVPPGPCPAQPEGKGSLSGLRSGQNPTWQEGGCTHRSGRPLCPTPAGNHQELGRWSRPACPTMPAGDGLPEPGVLVCERKSLEG